MRFWKNLDKAEQKKQTDTKATGKSKFDIV